MNHSDWEIHARIGEKSHGHSRPSVVLELSRPDHLGHVYPCDAQKLLETLPKIEAAAKKVLAANKPVQNETYLFRMKPRTVKAKRHMGETIVIQTPEGSMSCYAGNWIVTGIKGEQYPWTDEIFRASYDPVDEAGNVVGWPDET